MVRKTYTPEHIINKLREAEIHINQDISIAGASRKIGITEQTYYRWRREYGGLRIEQARKTQRRIPRVSQDEEARLVERIIELATQCDRYGYRRITATLPLVSSMRQWKALIDCLTTRPKKEAVKIIR